MLPFDIRHIVVCRVQKKLFTIKNSPVFFGPPCSTKWDSGAQYQMGQWYIVFRIFIENHIFVLLQ